MISTMLSTEQYQDIRARMKAQDAWVDTLRKRVKCRKCRGTGKARAHHSSYCTCAACVNGVCVKCEGKGFTLGGASYKPEDKPAHVPDVTNEERSKCEVWEFIRDKP